MAIYHLEGERSDSWGWSAHAVVGRRLGAQPAGELLRTIGFGLRSHPTCPWPAKEVRHSHVLLRGNRFAVSREFTAI